MLDLASHTVDSEFGRWTLTRGVPAAGSPLAGAVTGAWDFDGIVTTPRERVFPNGGAELLIQLDDRYLDVGDAGDVPTPAACVTGVHTSAFVIEAPPRPCRVIGVRLEPPAARALFGCSMSELADATVDLTLIAGRDVSEIVERCHGIGSGAERLRRVADWLARRLGRGRRAEPSLDPRIQHVAARIARTGGRAPIRTLRAETGLTPGRLAEGFRHYVGVTPKRYARIHRFQHALRLLNEPEPRLGPVALAAGYYDQSHMNADFRRMAGLTPGAYVSSRRFPASTHVAETASA